VQTKLVQALDLCLFADRLGAAIDQDAPSRPGLLIIFVCLECHQILVFGCGQLRSVGRAEDGALAVDNMIYRQDHYFPVGEKADPSDRNRGQQLQAPVERQYLEPCVIGRVSRHFALPEASRR